MPLTPYIRCRLEGTPSLWMEGDRWEGSMTDIVWDEDGEMLRLPPRPAVWTPPDPLSPTHRCAAVVCDTWGPGRLGCHGLQGADPAVQLAASALATGHSMILGPQFSWLCQKCSLLAVHIRSWSCMMT